MRRYEEEYVGVGGAWKRLKAMTGGGWRREKKEETVDCGGSLTVAEGWW